MSFSSKFLILSALIVLILAAFSINEYDYSSQIGHGMVINEEQLSQFKYESNGLIVNKVSNTIYINNSSVLLIEQSPGMGKMNSTFEEYFMINGMINPTIIAKDGIRIKLVVINMDNMEHNLAIINQPPPYPYMIMGGGMMGSSVKFLLYSNYLPPYSGGTNYPALIINFDANQMGTYWYLCTYPGHAQEGMYGKIVID